MQTGGAMNGFIHGSIQIMKWMRALNSVKRCPTTIHPEDSTCVTHSTSVWPKARERHCEIVHVHGCEAWPPEVRLEDASPGSICFMCGYQSGAQTVKGAWV